jgi:hypothetical protein
MIHLQAPDLGSLSSGSLVYFRKIPVGRVYDFTLNDNNQGVTVHQRGKVLQLHFGPAQADIGFDPRDVPETAAFFRCMTSR